MSNPLYYIQRQEKYRFFSTSMFKKSVLICLQNEARCRYVKTATIPMRTKMKHDRVKTCMEDFDRQPLRSRVDRGSLYLLSNFVCISLSNVVTNYQAAECAT